MKFVIPEEESIVDAGLSPFILIPGISVVVVIVGENDVGDEVGQVLTILGSYRNCNNDPFILSSTQFDLSSYPIFVQLNVNF